MSVSRFLARRRGLIGTSVALVCLAVVAAGCGSMSDDTSAKAAEAGKHCTSKTKVKVVLQWVAQAQFAGYYAAKDQGFYDAACLDVTIQEGGVNIVPQQLLQAGNVDFAVSHVTKTMVTREQGADLVNIGQVFQRGAYLQVSWADSGIKTLADLKGKKVGSWGYGNEWELFAGMQKDSVAVKDIKLVQQAFDMNGFLAGDIDAAQAMTYNEYAQVLESENPKTGELFKPEDLNVINWNDVGTAMLQDAIWAPSDKLKDAAFAEQTVKFIKASIKGWVYVRDNPEASAQLVTTAGSQLGECHQLWMTNEINKLIWPSTGGIGVIDPDAWKQTVDIALGTKNEQNKTIISQEPPASAYSNEYVEKALAELEAEGVDVKGTSFAPLTVTLKKGGA
jgi:NitT/TauT family transport system substrate-binding protein